jgi:hypothetical protein
LTVPESELRNVRQQIESGVGTTEVGVTDGGTMSAQAAQPGGTGGRARRRARRSYRMEVSRTEYLEQAVVYLEEIEDKVGTGGGGGGILDDVLGAVVETGGDAALEISDTATDAFTDTVGTALGNVIANSVSSSELSVEDAGPLTVEKPDWVPLAVEAVDPLPIQTPTLDVTDPSPLGVADPSPLAVADPSPLAVESPSPLPVEDRTFPVEDVDPLPVEDVGPISVEVSVNGSGSGSGSNRGLDGGNGGRWGVGVRGGSSFLQLGDSGEGAGIRFGGPNSEVSIGTGSYSTPSRRSGGGSTQVRDVSVSTNSETSVTVDPTGLNSLRDDVLKAFEDAQQDVKDGLQSQIDDLEAQLEDLRDEIRRAG